MSITTPTTAPIMGRTVFESNTLNRFATVVHDDAIVLDEGEFLARFHNTGYTFICKWTGRTRVFFGSRTRWGITCPTFDRFEIDTVVMDRGNGDALWGVKGAKLPGGTWAINPANLA